MENKNNDVEEDIQAFVNEEGHTKIDQDNNVLYTVYQPTYSKCTIDGMEKYIRGTVYVIKKTTDKDDAIEIADFTFNNMDDMYPSGVQIYQREVPSVDDILKDDTDLEKNGELGTCIWEKYSFDISEIGVLKMSNQIYRSKCINNNGEINRDELTEQKISSVMVEIIRRMYKENRVVVNKENGAITRQYFIKNGLYIANLRENPGKIEIPYDQFRIHMKSVIKKYFSTCDELIPEDLTYEF